MPNDPGDRRAELLRAHLADNDALCPSCGYNLRGLTGSRCPECNQELELSVGLVEPRLGAYLGALSSHMAGGGLAAIFLAVVTYISLAYGPPSRREVFPVFILPLIALVVHGGCLFALARVPGRVRFRKLNDNQRGATILGGWLLVVIFVAWFIVLVRW